MTALDLDPALGAPAAIVSRPVECELGGIGLDV